jgi:DNA-binding IclR family transcriptional regulator
LVVQKEEESAGSGIQAVAVTFEILEELSKSPAALGVSDLARRLGQTKARVHRHLTTLRALGLVSQDEASERYHLGWKIYRLGMSVAENFGLRRLAHRHVNRLAEETGQTSLLAMPANSDVIVVDAVQSNNQIAITVRPGAVIPATSSVLGRAILAFETKEAQEAALSQPIPRLTAETVSDPAALEQQLAIIKERWFEVASNQRLAGVAALAAPIFDDHDRIVASVGIIGPESAIPDNPDRPQLIRQVQDAARRISEELGSRTWQSRL